MSFRRGLDMLYLFGHVTVMHHRILGFLTEVEEQYILELSVITLNNPFLDTETIKYFLLLKNYS